MFSSKKILFSSRPTSLEDWVQKGLDIICEASYDWSNQTVSISSDGNTVAISSIFQDDFTFKILVKIYNWNGSTWTQKGQDINGIESISSGYTNLPGMLYGTGPSVSLNNDGNIVAIGTVGTSSENVRVYNYNGSNWIQLGQDIDGLAAGDRNGYSISLSSDGFTIAIGAPESDGNGTDSGHVRVYNYNGSTWVLKPPIIYGGIVDYSGISVSLSSDGNTVAIGARYNYGMQNDTGLVRVYNWNGSTWVQKGQIIYGEKPDDQAGYSVSLSDDGNTIAIGAPGANVQASSRAAIYNYNGSTWIQKGQTIYSEYSDQFGYSVSLSSDGNTVAIGRPQIAYSGNNSGNVGIYKWDGLDWVQLGQDIHGKSHTNWSGLSVSLSSNGNTVAISTLANEGYKTITVYNLGTPTPTAPPNNLSWIQKGVDIDDQASYDYELANVSLSSDGNTVAISAYAEGRVGHVRAYNWNGSNWVQKGQDIDGEAAGDGSGYSVSLSSNGNILAIGAPFNDANGNSSGLVRVYNYNGSSWTQLGSDINGESDYDQSGFSVSLSGDGNTIAIGAPYNDENDLDSISSLGHVRVYNWDGLIWNKLGNDIDGKASYDQTGYSVSLSDDGNTVAVGSYGDRPSSTLTEEGHVSVYNYNGSNWIQLGQDIVLRIFESVSLSSDGNIVAITTHQKTGEPSGTKVYHYNGQYWIQKGSSIDGIGHVSLSGDGNTVAITNLHSKESVAIVNWNGADWTVKGSNIAGEKDTFRYYHRISLSSDGNTVAIGGIVNPFQTPLVDGNGNDYVRFGIYSLTTPPTTTTIPTLPPLTPPNNPIITSVESLDHPELDGSVKAFNSVKIKWDLQGTNEQITSYDIQQSKDNGLNWTTIDSYTSNDGQQYDLFDIDYENKTAYLYTIVQGPTNPSATYLAGLVPGFIYSFRIRANNQAGSSSYSPRSSPVGVKVFVPRPVLKYYISAKNYVAVFWEAPIGGYGGAAVDYKVYWRDVSDPQLPGPWQDTSGVVIDWFSITGAYTKVDSFGNLYDYEPTVPGKTYEFQVSVRIVNGSNSKPTDPVLVTASSETTTIYF